MAAAGVQKAIDQYRLAQRELVKRNPRPLKEICSRANEVTIYGRLERFENGWVDQVGKRYDWRQRALLLAATMNVRGKYFSS